MQVTKDFNVHRIPNLVITDIEDKLMKLNSTADDRGKIIKRMAAARKRILAHNNQDTQNDSGFEDSEDSDNNEKEEILNQFTRVGKTNKNKWHINLKSWQDVVANANHELIARWRPSVERVSCRNNK